ncbi:hypothetical protein H8957_016866, partial [Semnopithecus entellus]
MGQRLPSPSPHSASPAAPLLAAPTAVRSCSRCSGQREAISGQPLQLETPELGVCLPCHREGWRQVRKIIPSPPQPSEQGVPLEVPCHVRATLPHFTGGETKAWRARDEGRLPRWGNPPDPRSCTVARPAHAASPAPAASSPPAPGASPPAPEASPFAPCSGDSRPDCFP